MEEGRTRRRNDGGEFFRFILILPLIEGHGIARAGHHDHLEPLLDLAIRMFLNLSVCWVQSFKLSRAVAVGDLLFHGIHNVFTVTNSRPPSPSFLTYSQRRFSIPQIHLLSTINISHDNPKTHLQYWSYFLGLIGEETRSVPVVKRFKRHRNTFQVYQS